MAETAADIYRLYVVPDYEEFLQQPGDRRRGKSAAESCYHFMDKLWVYYGEHRTDRLRGASTFPSFRDALLGECPDLAFVRDAADANKHFVLNRPTRHISTATDIWPVDGELEMRLDDGSTVRLRDKLKSAMAFWARELSS